MSLCLLTKPCHLSEFTPYRAVSLGIKKLILQLFCYWHFIRCAFSYLAKCSNTPPCLMDTLRSVTCFATFSAQKWHQNLAPGSSSPSSTEGLWRNFLASFTWKYNNKYHITVIYREILHLGQKGKHPAKRNVVILILNLTYWNHLNSEKFASKSVDPAQWFLKKQTVGSCMTVTYYYYITSTHTVLTHCLAQSRV